MFQEETVSLVEKNMKPLTSGVFLSPLKGRGREGGREGGRFCCVFMDVGELKVCLFSTSQQKERKETFLSELVQGLRF